MRLDLFSLLNRNRCEAANGFHHLLSSWSLSDWLTATCGELGEAANIIKKLNRVRDGIPGNDKTEDQLRRDLADEIADTFIYLDLLAQAAGLSLSEIVPAKFQKTSRKIGFSMSAADAFADHDLYGEPPAVTSAPGWDGRKPPGGEL